MSVLVDIAEILAQARSKHETNWPKPPAPPLLQQELTPLTGKPRGEPGLIERCGGYANITPEAWAEHDAAMAKWRLDRRDYYERLREARKPK
jgi:hypothetical protein